VNFSTGKTKEKDTFFFPDDDDDESNGSDSLKVEKLG
jgi:hypothetical protein